MSAVSPTNSSTSKFESWNRDAREAYLQQLLLEQEQLRRKAEISLFDYVRQAWTYVDPKPFQDAYHTHAICEHLQAISEGHIRQLIINIPPRFAKSLLTCVFWPTWEWGPANLPNLRWLFASYKLAYSVRDNRKSRDLIGTPWYQRNWGDRFQIVSDQAMWYWNNKLGFRMASATGAGATGEGADRLVVDDPLSASDAYSATAREKVVDPWWQQQFSNRVMDPNTVARVIVMQRLHQEDLTGWVLANEQDWVHLRLPMEYERKYHCVTQLGPKVWEDWRKEEGELLWPAQFGRDVVEAGKKRYGSYGTAGQYQQRPSPMMGGMFRKDWWQAYCEHPWTCPCGLPKMPASVDGTLTSWDMSFKDQKDNDFVVGGCWKWKGADRYLVDFERGQWDFTETCRRVQSLADRNVDAREHLIEETANGPAVIATLKSQIPGIVPIRPQGSKEARAHSVCPFVEAGNVWLPFHATWVEDFIEEHAAFPKGAHDDQVDMCSQALNRMHAKRFVEGIG